ncbi:MAG: hypothetical protein ACE5OZ_04815 [Candidatus Heimdallarchaeota archaeon]
MKSLIDPNIFRAYDIRGLYGQTIDNAIMMEIGRGAADLFKEKGINSVFIGFDVRTTSGLLASALVSAFSSYGIAVGYSSQPLPFGGCMFTGWREEYKAMAFVTASHLPPEWNGVKFYYGDGVGFTEEDLIEIRKRTIESQDRKQEANWDNVGPISQLDRLKGYITFLKERLSLERPLKIVVDCGNGSMCLTAPEIFDKLNYEVVKVFCDVDPTFPNRASEPNEESLRELSQKVIAENAAFGVGFDGDGDRAVIVDNTGKVLLADHIGTFLAKELIRNKKDPEVLINVECSLAVEKTLEGLADIVRIKVGHTFLTLEAKNRPNVIMGIESSGHMVFPEYFLFDDAILLPLALGRVLEMDDRTLADRIAEIPTLPKKRTVFACSDETKFQVVEEISKFLSQDFKVTTVDGVGVTFDDGWVLIRPSNTSPKIRLIVEAETEKRCSDLFEKFGQIVEESIKS